MSKMAKPYDYLIKFVLIGDCSVGKTSISNRFVENSFYDEAFHLGADFKTRTIELDGKRIKLQIWDTAGGERFRTYSRCFFRDAKGIFVVYDITNEKSFENVKHWMTNVEECAIEGTEKMMLGHKCDLEEERKVSTDQGAELAKFYGAKFAETSAKTDINIHESFTMLIKDIKETLDTMADSEDQGTDIIRLESGSSTSKWICGCPS